MDATGAFMLRFAVVAGGATAMFAIFAIGWLADTLVQFGKRYRQACRPQYGINETTLSGRLSFALRAAVLWPRI